MKTILVAIAFIAMAACRVEKDIQVEMVKVELIKIDTISRYTTEIKQLTWVDNDNIRYISFASLQQPYIVGTSSMVMKHR